MPVMMTSWSVAPGVPAPKAYAEPTCSSGRAPSPYEPMTAGASGEAPLIFQ